ncbi:MAG: hypothetical protein WCT03_10740 [Candidatus Obscuribacterales bacterium]
MQQRERKVVTSLLQYQQLKTAAGGSGVGGSGAGGGRGNPDLRRLRENQEITVRIVEAIPGGYRIKVADFDLPSYLLSDARIRIGEEILARFLCGYKDNLIFCPIAG